MMLKKVKNFLPVMGIGAITALTQLTMSGAEVSFTAEELSNIGSNLTAGAGSLVSMSTQLLPWMIFITIVGVVIGLIFGFGKLRIGSRKMRRIG